MLKFLFGFVCGFACCMYGAIQVNKDTLAKADKNTKYELSKAWGPAFKEGYTDAKADSKHTHEIFHPDCKSPFCPK